MVKLEIQEEKILSLILINRQRYRLTFFVGLEDGSFVGDDEGDNEGEVVGVV